MVFSVRRYPWALAQALDCIAHSVVKAAPFNLPPAYGLRILPNMLPSSRSLPGNAREDRTRPSQNPGRVGDGYAYEQQQDQDRLDNKGRSPQCKGRRGF